MLKFTGCCLFHNKISYIQYVQYGAPSYNDETTNIRMMSYDHHLRRREENQRPTEFCTSVHGAKTTEYAIKFNKCTQ